MTALTCCRISFVRRTVYAETPPSYMLMLSAHRVLTRPVLRSEQME